MAKQILQNVGILIGGYEIGTDMNSVQLEHGVDTPERTCFGDDTHVMAAGGLKVTTLGGAGYFNAENADAALFEKVGFNDELLTVLPNRDTDGSLAYFFRALTSQYAPGGSLGEMFAFSLSAAAGESPLVRGVLLHKADTIGASGSGPAVEAGAVSAQQRLYAGLHVSAVGGTLPTLDVTVESDDSAGFASPVTRVTFAQFNAIGAAFAAPVAGPITDSFWRLTFAIGGTAPSFNVTGVLGIQ